MFDMFDFAAIEKEVTGKLYAKDELVTFTIKTATANKDYGNVTVECVDADEYAYKFKLGAKEMTPAKKKLLMSFFAQFFTREQLIAKEVNLVELVGQRFEAKSNGQIEFQGKQYQTWQPSFRKLEPLATAEEFMV
jgi:hypothetical protein